MYQQIILAELESTAQSRWIEEV